MIIVWTYTAYYQQTGNFDVFTWSSGSGGAAPVAVEAAPKKTAYPVHLKKKYRKTFKYDNTRGLDWPYKY